MLRGGSIFFLYLMLTGCDDTLFASDAGTETYPPTWIGVTDFMDDHCVVCHSPDGEATTQLPTNLAEDLQTSGQRFVVPGDPEASLLWRVVSDTVGPDDYGVMPLGAGALPEPTVAHIREWILAGAPTIEASDDDGDGYTLATGDCDDSEAAVNPDAIEVCDGLDNDCDFITDEGVTIIGWLDEDGDGFGTGGEGPVCMAVSTSQGGDCNDGDNASYPGADERCGDQTDNDCDNLIDEASAVNAQSWYLDLDTDGFGDNSTGVSACDAPTGHVSDNTDCNDARSSDYPGSPEMCDGRDNDCDGPVDEGPPADAPTWYRDIDSDGYGDDTNTQVSCSQPNTYVALGGDCNDVDGRYNPDASETNCLDPNDYNCDGATGLTDSDQDGYGACEECDDTNNASYPGAPETCDSADNDCDGMIDENATDASTFFTDSDGDGYGTTSSVMACTQPVNTATNATDCNDADALAYPGATERCNGTDDDCDVTIDEDGVGGQTLYQDSDGDGYGTPSSTIDACGTSSGWVANALDCDDTSASISPDETTDEGDGIDNDCDGSIDENVVFTTTYADVQAIFDGSCTRACHGAPVPTGDLRLSGDSWPNIVNAPSSQAPLDIVEPFSTTDSYLWHKLQDTQTSVGGSGSMMPKTGRISDADLSTIEAWILDGAPRD